MYNGGSLWFAVASVTLLSIVQSVPPDKLWPLHIIKTRSIDLNNVQSLSMENRLPKYVKPTVYRLHLEPYLEDGMYKGEVTINITWVEASDEIVLHSDHEINITRTVLGIEENGLFEITPITTSFPDHRKPLYKISLEKTVSARTNGQINMTFEAKMNLRTTDAFFKTSYVDESEQESIVAATQLRPNNARKMFPCFDEPEYKTPFHICVARPLDMVALSNMPVKKVEDISGEPDAEMVHYKTTPPLSTFSLGLVVAKLKQLGNSMFYKDEKCGEIELRVWGREEFLPALEGLPEKLHLVFSEIYKWWQVNITLPKLDIVALPNYHGIKPSDNWGLIIFKESDLTSRGYLQLAQEIGYQWVGAMTTPSWWTHSHLNKALVGYIAAETVLKINNGVEMEGKWPMTVLYSLYYEFSKRFPHSRITGMKQETACTQIELLLRMFNYTLGAERLKKGIRNFVDNRKFQTFNDEDLWNSIQESIKELGIENFHVGDVVKSWLNKTRLPILVAKRDYKLNSVTIRQKMFLRERPHEVYKKEDLRWMLPVVVVEQNKLDFTKTTTTHWMREGVQTFGKFPADKFIIINPEEIAPYLVNYDQQNWNMISKYLQSENRENIPELTRAKLLHDAWNLAYGGELSFAVALDMTMFLKNERNHIVWDPVFTMIDHIGKQIGVLEVNDKFQEYTLSLLTPLYKDLSNNEDNEETWRKNLRSLTKTFLCKAGYEPCIEEAREEYRKWMEAPNPDEGNPIANQYICPVFKWGSMDEWLFGLDRVVNFPSSRKPSERTYLLKTLAGCPRDDVKISKLLQLSTMTNNGNFSDTDVFLIFSMLTSSPKGYTTLFEFLRSNFDALKEKYISNTNLWDSLITAATSHFTTKEGLNRVRSLAEERAGQFGSAAHIVENSLKIIAEEAKWSDMNIPVIKDWLADYLVEIKKSS